MLSSQMLSASLFLCSYKDISEANKDVIMEKLKEQIKGLYKNGADKNTIKAKTTVYLKQLVKLTLKGKLLENAKENDSNQSLLRKAQDPSNAAKEDATKPVSTDEELPSISETPQDFKTFNDEPNSDTNFIKKRKALMKVVDKLLEEKSQPHKYFKSAEEVQSTIAKIMASQQEELAQQEADEKAKADMVPEEVAKAEDEASQEKVLADIQNPDTDPQLDPKLDHKVDPTVDPDTLYAEKTLSASNIPPDKQQIRIESLKNEIKNLIAGMPSESIPKEANDIREEVLKEKQHLVSDDEYKSSADDKQPDSTTGVAPNPDIISFSPTTIQMEDHNELLDNIPNAKVAVKPAQLNDEDAKELTGNYFTQNKGVQIYVLTNVNNKFEQLGNQQDNKILIANNNFSIMTPDETIIINMSSVAMSCYANQAPSVCLGVEIEPQQPGVTKQIQNAGLEPTDPNLLVVEVEDGKKLQAFKFRDTSEMTKFRLVVLLLQLRCMTRSVKFQTQVPNGEIIIDSNSGAIIEKQKSPLREDIIVNIPISSLSKFTQKIGKSEVSLAYIRTGDDGNEEEKKLDIVVPINPEGVRTNPIDKQFQAKKLQDFINTSSDVQFQQYLDQKSKLFLSGIQKRDIIANQNAGDILNVVYQVPLSVMIKIQNQMAAQSCIDKFNQLIQIAKEQSFGNQLILNDYLYNFFVKGIGGNTNPSFDNVELQGEMSLFNEERLTKDKEEVHLINNDIAFKLGRKWLQHINEEICEQGGKSVSLDTYNLIFKQSLYHQDLATNSKWLPQIDIDLLKVPQSFSGDEEMPAKSLRDLGLLAMLKFQGLIERQPTDVMLKQYENMLHTHPRTSVYTFYSLHEDDSYPDPNEQAQLTSGLSNTKKQTELDSTDLYNELSKEWGKIEVKSLQLVPNDELGDLVDYEDMFKPLADDQIKVMESTNLDLLDKVFEGVMKDWGDDYAMSYYQQDANRDELIDQAMNNQMEIIADLINSSGMLDKLIQGEIPCQKVEVHIKNFCNMLNALLAKEFDQNILNKMKQQLTDAAIASASKTLAQINGEGLDKNSSTGANASGGTNASGGANANGAGKNGDSNSSNDSGAASLLNSLNDILGALGKMSLDEIIAAIKKTLDLDDKNTCKLDTIWGDATYQVKAMTEQIADKILKGLDISKPSDQGDTQYGRFETLINGASIPKGKCPLLVDFNKSTLQDHTKENLIKALAFALQNPAFADAFNKANQGLLDTVKKAAEGNEEVKNLPTSDALTNGGDGGALEAIANNSKAATQIINQMLKDGKIDEQTAEDINNAILGLLDIIAEKDKNDQEKNAAAIAADQIKTDQDNCQLVKRRSSCRLLKLATLNPLPAACASAFGSFLNSLDTNDLANATLSASANDPNLAADVNNINALSNIVLSTEDMKKFLLEGAKNENDRVSSGVLNACIKAEGVGDKVAKAIVDALNQVDQTKDIELNLKSELTANEKLDNLANGPEKPVMPDSAQEQTVNAINLMDDEHIEVVFNLASGDQDFNDFLNNLLADEIQEQKDSASASPNNADAAKSLGLSPDEMRKALKNGNDMFLAFAAGDTDLAADLMDDAQAKNTLRAQAPVGDLLTNDNDKQNLATITNSPASDADKISRIVQSESLINANKDKLTDNINDVCLNQFSDDKITELFNLVVNDPNMLAMLLEANPGINDKKSCIQNPQACQSLYDMNGTEIPLDTIVEQNQLGKLMKLQKNSDGFVKATDNSIKISNSNEVKINDEDCSTQKEMVNIKDRTVFDLALTPEQAAERRLQLIAIQASDMNGLYTQEGTDSDADLNKMRDDLMKNMGKMLNNLVDGVLNREILDVHRKQMEAYGLTAADSPTGPAPPGGPTFDLLPEEIEEQKGLEDLVSPNETKSFALDEDSDTVEFVMKTKCLKDVMLAQEIDELLAQARKLKLLDGKEIDKLKMNMLNQYADMDKPEYVINDTDDQPVLMEKMEKLIENIRLFSIQSDFIIRPDNKLDFTHANLEQLLKKQEVTEATTNLAMESDDLRTLVAFSLQQNTFIMTHSVFILTTKNMLRKNGNDQNELPKSITESSESDDLLEEYKLRGMVNIAFFFRMKNLFMKALTGVLMKLEGDVEKKVKMIMDKFVELIKQMASLPEFIDAFVFQVTDARVLQPPPDELYEAQMEQINLAKGVIPLGDFWLMTKLKANIEEEDFKKQPTKIEVITAGATIYRFRSNEVLYRSMDMISSIQHTLKGDDMRRDWHRDIMWLFVMPPGDMFLDQVQIRNDKIKKDLNPKTKDSEDGGDEVNGTYIKSQDENVKTKKLGGQKINLDDG